MLNHMDMEYFDFQCMYKELLDMWFYLDEWGYTERARIINDFLTLSTRDINE